MSGKFHKQIFYIKISSSTTNNTKKYFAASAKTNEFIFICGLLKLDEYLGHEVIC